MADLNSKLAEIDRRNFLRLGGAGLGGMAVSQLQARDANSAGLPHHRPQAKRVIYLFQSGGPSQVDLFDYKPMLRRFHGQDIFKLIDQSGRLTGFTNKHESHPVIDTRYKFARQGQCGAWVSELLPKMSGIVDDVCTIRSVSTKPVNHDPALTFMQTGHNLPGRPSIGSWLSYGLGTMNRDLPDFVVLVSKGDLGNMQPLNNRLWGSGFLSARYAGVRLRSGAEPVLYLKDPAEKPIADRRKILDVINQLNEAEFSRSGDPEVAARIAQYEMAFRMQTSVPELADLSDEPESTYPSLRRGCPSTGYLCLQLLDGSPTRGTGGSIYSALPLWLGPSLSPPRKPTEALPGNRPGHGGADNRPKAARVARRHDRYLGG